MNPSTKDILDAFEGLPTDKVVILPNNKNIIFSAEQAKEVTVKHVQIVPSRTIPQGLAAMLHLSPDGNLEIVAEKMRKALLTVRTAEVTIATRTVGIDGVDVKEGQVIGLLDGKLSVSSDDIESVCLQILDKAQTTNYELITLFYGSDLSHSEANRIADKIRIAFPNQEVEVQDGGQPHYQFIISIE
jgi:dihydroxyacetone kinase-like predicted kinase